MLSINTNLSSLIAQSSMKQSTNRLNQAIERMTTGFKINHAKDNAANYSISTNMTTKIGAYNVAEDNAAMGLDLIATAEGTLDQIEDKLQRLRALAEQAANGTYGGGKSGQAISAEANALVDEINRLYLTAEYNGIKLFGSTEVSPDVATFAMARAVIVDESKRVSKVSSFLAGETYYITDSTDLIALQDFVNGGGDTTNVTFELTADIDMQGVSFRGIGTSATNSFKGSFSGNGNIISNLVINTTEDYVGLFGYVKNAKIDSIGLENSNITGANYTSGLVGYLNASTITNAFVTGKVAGVNFVGGLVGRTNTNAKITNCYTASSVSGTDYVGGLVGSAYYVSVLNSYVTGNIIGNHRVGGLLAYAPAATITNSYVTGTVIGNTDTGGFIGNSDSSSGSGNYYNQDSFAQAVGGGSFSGVETKSLAEITAPANLESMGFTEANGWKIVNGQALLAWQSDPVVPPSGDSDDSTTDEVIPPTDTPNTILLQIGASSDWASQVGVSTKFSLIGVDNLRMIGLDLATDYLGQIDEMLALVSEKQTHFGATSNRLESVLEEITIQRDNLISSRSTIRDADIAEVSSTYIQQQILQQASATLLATANQSPSIALQLI